MVSRRPCGKPRGRVYAKSLLEVLLENTDELPDVRDLIARAINDDPPAKLSDGDTIRAGYSPELDELRSTSRNAKQIIATLEATERSRSGINNLRIRFNGVFGYYIEVSKANAARVPVEYERRQTLANAERFTTPELRDWEKKVLGAEERIVQLETELFTEVCRHIACETLESFDRVHRPINGSASILERLRLNGIRDELSR